jgi:NTE family protein
MKKTALALGGGAVLGAAHVGVLRAMSELHIQVSMISGTSIGAFIAALHAFGKSWQEIRDIAVVIDWFDLSSLTLSQYGLLSNKKFGALVTELLGEKDIKDALIPLSMVATDIGSGKKVVFTEGNVAAAVMASSCIPGIFRPVDYSGMLMVDGMLVENVPVSPLVEHGAESIVSVDLLAFHVFKKPENIIGILLNAFYSSLTNTTAIQTADADLSISPNLSKFNLIDFSQIPDLIEAGYQASFPLLNVWMEKNSSSSGLVESR